jgi:hypothetical protein
MIFYLLALLLGVVAGLRAMTPPTLIAWAAYLGWLDLSGKLARLSRQRLVALDTDIACGRRAGHGSTPFYAQPYRADPIRRAHRDGSTLWRRCRPRVAGRWRAGCWQGLLVR